MWKPVMILSPQPHSDGGWDTFFHILSKYYSSSHIISFAAWKQVKFQTSVI